MIAVSNLEAAIIAMWFITIISILITFMLLGRIPIIKLYILYILLLTIILVSYWLKLIIDLITVIPFLIYTVISTEKYWKPIFVKKWAKDIAYSLKPTDSKAKLHPQNLSIDDSGGEWIDPLKISWRDVYTNWPEPISVTPSESLILIKKYFFNLHDWAHNQLSNDYFLWSDGLDIYLLFVDPNDRLFCNLKWDGKMPTPAEIKACVDVLKTTT